MDSAHTKWYTSEMAATPVHIWAGFARLNAGADLRPLLRDVRTPTLYLAAQGLEGTRRGDFRETTDLFPNGRLVVFPGVSGYVHHSMPEACANAWLDFAGSLKVPGD